MDGLRMRCLPRKRKRENREGWCIPFNVAVAVAVAEAEEVARSNCHIIRLIRKEL
jgi:hypothetical protein